MKGKGKLTRKEYETWNAYHCPGCGNMTTVKVDVVHFHMTADKCSDAHMAHELKKAEIAYELRASMDHHFITEAVRNQVDENGKKRRVDLVDLTDGTEYEIETSMKRALRFVNDPVVIIIPVGWKTSDKKWKEMLRVAKET